MTRSRISQKLNYFKHILPFPLWHSSWPTYLGEDMLVNDDQRSLQKLLIPFRGQTDTSKSKDILNKFRKPIKGSWKPQSQVQCSILKLGMYIMEEGKTYTAYDSRSFFISMYFKFYIFFRFGFVIGSSAFDVDVNIKDTRKVVFLQPRATTWEMVQQFVRGAWDGGVFGGPGLV